MKHAILLCAALLALVQCGSKPSQAVQTLNVFTWADYIDPQLVKEFEAKNNCKITFSYFDSNEQMLAKVKAGGSSYDVLYPSSYAVKLMLTDNMLMALDPAKIPNMAQMDPKYLALVAEQDMKHSVPYTVSTTGIGYLAELGELEPTWAVFANPELKGRMTLLDDIRETIGAALKFHGYSLNTTSEEELATARDTVIGWKKNAAKFESVQYHHGLASGEFKLVQGYIGDILQAQAQNPNIRFMLPKEGFAFTCDQLVIPKNAKNPDLAHAWINFLCDPEIAARNTNFMKFLCPNLGSYGKLSPELRDNPALFPPPDVLARAEYIDELGKDLDKYNKVWDEIKAAQ